MTSDWTVRQLNYEAVDAEQIIEQIYHNCWTTTCFFLIFSPNNKLKYVDLNVYLYLQCIYLQFSFLKALIK